MVNKKTKIISIYNLKIYKCNNSNSINNNPIPKTFDAPKLPCSLSYIRGYIFGLGAKILLQYIFSLSTLCGNVDKVVN